MNHSTQDFHIPRVRVERSSKSEHFGPRNMQVTTFAIFIETNFSVLKSEYRRSFHWDLEMSMDRISTLMELQALSEWTPSMREKNANTARHFSMPTNKFRWARPRHSYPEHAKSWLACFGTLCKDTSLSYMCPRGGQVSLRSMFEMTCIVETWSRYYVYLILREMFLQLHWHCVHLIHIVMAACPRV